MTCCEAKWVLINLGDIVVDLETMVVEKLKAVMVPGKAMGVMKPHTGIGVMMQLTGTGVMGLYICIGDMMRLTGAVAVGIVAEIGVSILGGGVVVVGRVGGLLLPVTVSYSLCTMFPCSISRAPDRMCKSSVSLLSMFRNFSLRLLDIMKLGKALILEKSTIRFFAEFRVSHRFFRALNTEEEIRPDLLLMVRTRFSSDLTFSASCWQNRLLAFIFATML